MNNWFDRFKSRLKYSKRVERLEPLRNDEPRHLDKRLLLGLLGGASGAAISRRAMSQTVHSPSPAGTRTVASIAALMAVATPIAGQQVYLSAVGLAGYFVWQLSSAAPAAFGGNYQAAISNDPGQGQWVAWSGDSAPGTTGAWVRQWPTSRANLGWWSVVGDAQFGVPVPPAPFRTLTPISGTDNAAALANFGCFARYWSLTLGLGLVVEAPVPTGQGFIFNSANCGFWASGILEFEWLGGGTFWQDIYTGPSLNTPWSRLSNPFDNANTEYSWQINQVTPGALGFSMLNITDLFVPAGSYIVGHAYQIWSLGTTSFTSIGAPSNTVGVQFVATGVGTGTGVAIPVSLVPGISVAVMSMDNQFLGGPANTQQFEFPVNTGIAQYAAATPTSVTYTSGTGLLVLSFALAPLGPTISPPAFGQIATSATLFNGIAIPISGITGTGGGVAALNATWPIFQTSSPVLTTISSGSYNSTTGLVTLTLAASQSGLSVGTVCVISGATGTGQFANIDVTYAVAGAGSGGTTLTFTIATGLTMTITGGNFAIQGSQITLQAATGLTASALSGGSFGPVAIVTTQKRMQYQHLTTFVDDSPAVVKLLAGKARVWGTTTGPLTINDGLGNPHVYTSIPWDITHKWRDWTVGLPLWVNTRPQNEAIIPINGKAISHYNYSGIGPVESVSNYDSVDCTILSQGETDKVNGNLSYRGLKYFATMGFQSAAENVYMERCYANSLATGNAKKFKAVSSLFGVVSVGGALGAGSNQKFESCEIASWGGGTAIDGGAVQTVDNSTAVFFGTAASGIVGTGAPANLTGVITLLKTSFPSGVGTWSMPPGTTVCLLATLGVWTASLLNSPNRGDGFVMASTEDSTCVYIQTTLPFATLPAWSNSQIMLIRNQGATFDSCSGCDPIRQASAAFANNQSYKNYKQYWLGAAPGQAFATQLLYSSFYGNLTKVIVTIHQNGNSATCAVTISFGTYNSASNFVQDTGSTTITTVVGVGTQRIFTQTAGLVGFQSGDNVVCNGVTLSGSAAELPPGRITGRTGTGAQINTASLGTIPPLVEIEMFWDNGIAGQMVTTNYDNNGNFNQAFATLGQLT